jgi:hypothetical protein
MTAADFQGRAAASMWLFQGDLQSIRAGCRGDFQNLDFPIKKLL